MSRIAIFEGYGRKGRKGRSKKRKSKGGRSRVRNAFKAAVKACYAKNKGENAFKTPKAYGRCMSKELKKRL